MSIIPEGEGVRKAVKWISEMRKDNPQTPITALVQEASLKFDLTPLEADYLSVFYKKVD